MRRMHTVISIFVVIFLLAGALPLQAVAQEASPVAGRSGGLPDLAAMPLTPGDLTELGISGFGRFSNGSFLSFDTFAEVDARNFGHPLEEARASYERFGWQRFFSSASGLPSIPGEDSPASRGWFSNIHEFADAAGADAYLTYISSPGPESEATIVYADSPFTIGDRTLLYEVSTHDPDRGRTFVEINIYFRLNNLVVDYGFGTNVPDQTVTPEASQEATPVAENRALNSAAGTMAEMEALGRRQVERIESVLAGNSPNLGNVVLRLGGAPPTDVDNYSEGYRMLDGELLPYYADRADDIIADPGTRTGADAVYELEEFFRRGEEDAPGDSYFLTRLFQFPDDATATTFMSTRAEVLATGGFARISDAAPETREDLLPGEITDLGDESLAFSFVRAFTDGYRVDGFELFVRVGKTVAAVSLEGPPGMTIDGLAEIAAAQADCLQAGSCADALPVPASFRAPLSATPEATPAA